MSRFSAEYRIARSTGVCAATGQHLEPGSPCVAVLCEREEDDGFDRKDYSPAAWEAGARPQGLFSNWKTTVPHPDARRQVFVDDQVLIDLFDRLAGDERRQRFAFRFILALILMRKRIFKYVGRAGDGENECWRLRPRGADPDPPPIEVINPHLSDGDVRELTDQLSDVLRGEL